MGQSRRSFDQYLLESSPQRKNPIIWRKVSTQCSVSLIRIAVEPDVLGEEMLKCLLKRAVPMPCC